MKSNSKKKPAKPVPIISVLAKIIVQIQNSQTELTFDEARMLRDQINVALNEGY